MTHPLNLFREAGEGIFGLEWKSPMARALHVNERNLRRMADGKLPIPASLWNALGDLVLEEVKRLEGIAKNCKGG